MRRLMSVFVIMLVCVVVSGCTQDVKNAWKTTKKYYREYVNTPAKLSLSDAGADPVEDRLAMVYTPLGMELERFRRDIENKDSYPNEQWMLRMLKKYPWLSGLAAVNMDGRVLLQRPEFGMKSLDFSEFIQSTKPEVTTDDDDEVEYRVSRALYGTVQENPLGDEVIIGMPYFSGNEHKGFVIAHFDPRNFVATAEQPELIVMLSSEGPLWSGYYRFEETPLAGRDWKEVMEDDSSGYFSNDTGEFFWVSKYLGSFPLAFAATSDSFPIDPDAMKALEPVSPVPSTADSSAGAASVTNEEALQEMEKSETQTESSATSSDAPAPVVPALHEEPTKQPATTDYVWSVQIGAFQNPNYAQDRLELLRKHGVSPCLMKLYDNQGQLWNVVQIGDYRSKSKAFQRVGEFLKLGTGLDFNVEILDAGVVERRKQCF